MAARNSMTQKRSSSVKAELAYGQFFQDDISGDISPPLFLPPLAAGSGDIA